MNKNLFLFLNVEDVPSHKKKMKVFLTYAMVFFIGISSGFSQENQKVKHVEKIKIGEEVKDVNVNYSFKNIEGKGTL